MYIAQASSDIRLPASTDVNGNKKKKNHYLTLALSGCIVYSLFLPMTMFYLWSS